MRSLILSTLTLATTLTLAACDTAQATSGECAVTLVGVQPVAADQDGNGQPDHAPWAAAQLKGDCTAAELAGYQVAAYGTSPGLTYRGAAQVAALASDCVVWTWPTALGDLGSWAVLVTPMAGGDAAAVWSDQISDFQAPSSLPAWNTPEGWALYLPGVSVPTGCDLP